MGVLYRQSEGGGARPSMSPEAGYGDAAVAVGGAMPEISRGAARGGAEAIAVGAAAPTNRPGGGRRIRMLARNVGNASYAAPGSANSGVPTASRNLQVPILERFFLSGETGFVSTVTTAPIPGYGNAVAIALHVHFASLSSRISATLQGSYNGRVWKTIVTSTQAGSGYTDQLQQALAYPWYRVFLDQTGGAGAAGTVDFSIGYAQL